MSSAVPASPQAVAAFQVIVNRAAYHRRIPAAAILGRQRHRRIVRARQLVAYVAHVYLGYTLAEIGALMDRDHTTISHSINVIRDQFDCDPGVEASLWRIVGTSG